MFIQSEAKKRHTRARRLKRTRGHHDRKSSSTALMLRDWRQSAVPITPSPHPPRHDVMPCRLSLIIYGLPLGLSHSGGLLAGWLATGGVKETQRIPIVHNTTAGERWRGGEDAGQAMMIVAAQANTYKFILIECGRCWQQPQDSVNTRDCIYTNIGHLDRAMPRPLPLPDTNDIHTECC